MGREIRAKELIMLVYLIAVCHGGSLERKHKLHKNVGT
jgi:hypothetical protein